MAISNAIGGIAAQTAFLAIADFFNREANLEHQAASIPNILNGVLLIVLLAGLLIASDSPNVSILGIHPATAVLFVSYVLGMRLVRRSFLMPQWKPSLTQLTRVDQLKREATEVESLSILGVRFLFYAIILATAGWLVARSGMVLVSETGLSETVVGGIFAAVLTSLPELVTAIAAVRIGALTLAVGNILGGNAFDVLFAVAADIAYRSGVNLPLTGRFATYSYPPFYFNDFDSTCWTTHPRKKRNCKYWF